MKKNEKKSSADKEIGELMAENRRLRSENASLKRELADAKGKLSLRRKENPHHALFAHQANNESLFAKKRYSGYVLQLIRNTTVFSIYTKILYFVRRYTFISLTVQILAAILTVVQSSAIFVLATSASVIALPFIFIISYVAFLVAHLSRRKNDVVNKKLIARKKIVVFFPPKGRALAEDSFFSGMVREFAADPDRTCLIVSPYFFRPLGLGSSKKAYFFSRAEGENIILLRRQYYFTLKKKILNRLANDITEIF